MSSQVLASNSTGKSSAREEKKTKKTILRVWYPFFAADAREFMECAELEVDMNRLEYRFRDNRKIKICWY